MSKDTPTLNITIHETVDSEYVDEVTHWLYEVVGFLLSVPRPTGMDWVQPRYEEIAFRITGQYFDRGLRHVGTGVGWMDLHLSEYLWFDTSPVFRRVTDTQTASQGNWSYILSQLNRAEHYYRPEYEPERHMYFQLLWLESQSSINSNAASILHQYETWVTQKEADEKRQKYLRQFPEKRALRLARQKESRRFKAPEEYRRGYKPHYCTHQSPPPQPPAPPVEHPEAQLSQQDKDALETIERQARYMESFCEDHDK